MVKNDFDIFTVSETWDYSVMDLEVEIPGYDVYRLDRHEKTGGGVCACVTTVTIINLLWLASCITVRPQTTRSTEFRCSHSFRVKEV